MVERAKDRGAQRRAPSVWDVVAVAAAALIIGGCAAPAATPSADRDGGSDGLLVDTADGGCHSAADCPAAKGTCEVATCSASGVCGIGAAPEGSPCVDGDPCTHTVACSGGTCVGPSSCACTTDADCAPSEDGDLCNGSLYCDHAGAQAVCKVKPSTVVTCDTSLDTACASTTCVAALGTCAKQPAPDGQPCDDGVACSDPDACQAGSCVGASACGCANDTDCAAVEDGDLCNGTLYCAGIGGKDAVCKVNPATVVVCPGGAPGACSASQCQAADGTCKVGPKAAGSPCDIDGSSCSLDVCQGGSCVPGALADPCICSVDADCGAFDDGNACNGKLFCSKPSGHCELNPATVIVCPSSDDTTCRSNTCQPSDGSCAMVEAPDSLPCDDGWDCSVGDQCQQGSCAPQKGGCACTTTADCAAWEASNACAKFYCDKPAGVCKPNPATFVACTPLGDPQCSTTTCAPKTGKCSIISKNEGGPCEADGSWCTNLDTCAGGACVAAKSKCPCQADGDCDAFEDSDACNGKLYCDKPSGGCLVNPATVMGCSSGGGPCKTEACDPADGKCKASPLKDGTPCDDDGLPCTTEACAAGACKVTGDACLCWADADCLAFDDADLCNGKLYCDKSGASPACKLNPASVIVCPPTAGSGCVVASCDAKDGTCKGVPANDGTPCDDGSACTSGDACAGNTCAGAALTCDDGKPCTTDSCDKLTGCKVQPLNGQEACEDGDACTEGDGCTAGLCKGQAPTTCADEDLCTTMGCDPKVGCTVASAVGSLCPGGACGEAGCVLNPAFTTGASASGHAFAIFGGAAIGWGRNVHGMLPAAVTGEGPHPPTVLSVSGLVHIGASESRACGVDGLGQLTCWGRNHKGEAFAPAKITTPTPILQVAGAADDVLLLGSDGAIYALGKLETPTAVSKLVSPIGNKPFIRVAAGHGFACAVQQGGVPHCWGDNSVGQLGQGAGNAPGGAPTTSPLAVAIVGVQDLCAGSNFACALDAKAVIRCWGAGDSGQLGDGKAKDAPAPVVVVDTDKAAPTGPAAKALRCGLAHACLQAADGRVLCWGDNDRGALGVGDTAPHAAPTPVVSESGAVFPLLGGKLMATATGGCILGGATAHCWGDDGDGLLGLWQAGAATDAYVPAPVRKADGSKLVGVTKLVGSGGAFCGRVASDPKDVESPPTWWCWGSNHGGVTGLQGPFERTLQSATAVSILAGAGAVSVTPDEGCRVIEAGGQSPLRCWGTNIAGATLGVDTGAPVTQPTAVIGAPEAVTIRRGPNHACVVDPGGALRCWGHGGFGALGQGTTPKAATAQQVSWSDGLGALGVGPFHTCAANLMKAVKCWGDNSFGMIGNGKQGNPEPSPTFVSGNQAIAELSLGPLHSCGVDVGVGSQGKVWCWGHNGGVSNALGVKNGGILIQESPVQVAGFGGTGQPKAQGIAVGTMASCAIDEVHALRCWGDNVFGQLGLGAQGLVAFDQQPLSPKGLGAVEEVHFGAYAVCARTVNTAPTAPSNSEVWCWGTRQGGQVGRGIHLRTHVVARKLPVGET